MHNICQGEAPRAMLLLEIGCGAGRLTRALAGVFGEVHAVNVSGEMITRAIAALADESNAHVYRNNGCDLAVVPPLEFDFAYSKIVFQHIPYRKIIQRYVRIDGKARLLEPLESVAWTRKPAAFVVSPCCQQKYFRRVIKPNRIRRLTEQRKPNDAANRPSNIVYRQSPGRAAAGSGSPLAGTATDGE